MDIDLARVRGFVSTWREPITLNDVHGLLDDIEFGAFEAERLPSPGGARDNEHSDRRQPEVQRDARKGA